MRLLLDTQVFLWSNAEPNRLGRLAEFIADPQHPRFLSAASTWEIAIKFSAGRLSLESHPSDFVPARMESLLADPLPIDASHALTVTDLPPHHRDPFDRLLIAQAMVENLTIATADETFLLYTDNVIMPEG